MIKELPKKSANTSERIKINKDEIKEAISQSGYLIEQRVIKEFSKRCYVESNYMYLDPNTGKSREIDLRATSHIPGYKDSLVEGIHWSIFCECENNLQPVVFFPYKRLMPDSGCWYIKCF